MIWEQKSHIIVMLTRLVEKNVVKADLYWPEGPPVQYGIFRISLVGLENQKGIIIRHFLVQNLQTQMNRTVMQLHFQEWPDHGVPVSTDGIRSLITLKNEYKRKNMDSSNEILGPVVVHCSAGIGRSGTLIAIDLLLKDLKSSNELRIFSTVLDLRSQRYGMVQTYEQYEFIYKFVREELSKQDKEGSCLLSKFSFSPERCSASARNEVQEESQLLTYDFNRTVQISTSERKR